MTCLIAPKTVISTLHIILAQNFRKHHINTIQPWAEYDHCESWFQTGITSLDHDVGLVMNEFKKGSDKNPGKFALETRSPDTWIKIVNPQDQPAHLLIEYMVTRPDCMYLVTRLSIVGSGESDSVTVKCEDLPYPWTVHITSKLQPIGRVPPGESMLRVEALQPGKGGDKWPFRIVALMLAPGGDVI